MLTRGSRHELHRRRAWWPTRRRRVRPVLGIATLVGISLFGVSATSAHAATDGLFAAPAATGSGDCSSPADACSIATAVTNANAMPIADSVTIELASGTYALGSPSPRALSVTFAGPSLTFEAEGGTPILDGMHSTGLLSVGSTSTVTVDGLEFESAMTGQLGGGIQNSGTLTVNNSTFVDNTAANGGAIGNVTGATLIVRGSTFSHNAGTSVGGGAIISIGTATIERSALIDNTARINGGAINVQPGATVTVASSTIAGNTSAGVGGGLSALGMLAVENSTLTDNTGSGGGTLASSDPNHVTFAGDLIASRSSVAACFPANAAITDGGYNLDDDGTCISPTSPATGSHNGLTADGSSTFGAVLDAYLAAVPAGNGGPTQTLALLNTPNPSTTLDNPAVGVVPASFDLPVAVDGLSSSCSLPDQRGVMPVPGANCDIGAYLLQATRTALPEPPPTTVGQTVTYTATVIPAPDAGTVSFTDGAGNPATTGCGAQSLSGGTATCTVAYASTGVFPVTATYSGDGTTNDFVASGSSTFPAVVTAAGVVAPPIVSPSVVAPTLSKLRVVSHALKAGHTVHVKATFTLSAAGTVRVTLARKTTGREVLGPCVKTTRSNHHQSHCTLLVGVHEPTVASGPRGSRTFKFAGKLRAGTYQLTATPVGGTPRAVTFQVASSPTTLLQLTDLLVSSRTIRWCRGCEFPQVRLAFGLSRSAVVHLTLSTQRDGTWRQVGTATSNRHTGQNRIRVAGRWHGHLVPTGTYRVMLYAKTPTGRSDTRTIVLEITHAMTDHTIVALPTPTPAN
jgi:hypothetical protein